MSADEDYQRLLTWRGIDTPCPVCGGSGRCSYASTSTWRGGVGGMMITDDVCDKCWGSGDVERPGLDLRKLFNTEDERIHAAALKLLTNAAGCAFDGDSPEVTELVAELRKLSRGRKPRPRGFHATCAHLATTLEQCLVARRREFEARKVRP